VSRGGEGSGEAFASDRTHSEFHSNTHYLPDTPNPPQTPVHVDNEIDAALLLGDGVDRIVKVHLQSAAGRMIMQAPACGKNAATPGKRSVR